MMRTSREAAADLFAEASSGRQEALDAFVPALYAELRRVAGALLRSERPGHTLQPTALVHEAYMRLADQSGLQWESPTHFINIGARVMRQVLVDHARRRRAGKRAGGLVRVTFDERLEADPVRSVDAAALGDALEALEARDPRLVRVVELRYFGGLSIAETAETLGIGTATVEREWRAARAWLRKELAAEDAE